MVKAAKALVFVLVLGVLVSGVLADAVSAQKRAQQKALALRAARADAMRRLGERINGLNITSTTKVKDFVTESDQIKSGMRAFLLGMREKEKSFSEDGAAEVVMEVTLDEVIRALRKVHSDFYKAGKKFKAADFSKMSITNKKKIIRVVGNGAPREDEIEEDLVPAEDGVVSWGKFSTKVKDFWRKNCSVRGRFMAKRAAQLDAMRRIAERIKGVQIDSETTVQDFVAESDTVRTAMSTFLRGIRENAVRYHSDELICEVEMQVKLKQVFAMVYSNAKVDYNGDKMKLRKLEQRTMKTETRVIKETGMGVPPQKYLNKTPPALVAATLEIEKRISKTPPWATAVETAVGNGAVDPERKAKNAAQAKLMAFRAAELDARRKLGERLEGLMITSSTSVRDFVAESDEIQTDMMTFQVGAYVVDGSQKVDEDGMAEVTVAIEMRPWWNKIIFYKKKLGLKLD